jgi:hypothetical protein
VTVGKIVKREKLQNGQYRDTVLLGVNRHFGRFFLAGIVKGRDGFPKNRWIYDDVVTVTPNTATNKAYKYGVGETGQISNPDVAVTEFSTADYAAVQVYGGAIMSSVATRSSLGYANVAHLFTFDTSPYPSISNIVFWWGGYETVSGSANIINFWLSVYQATTWVNLDNLTNVNSDTEFSHDLGNGSSYFYNTSWIRFGAWGCCQRIIGTLTVTLYGDYAALVITYTPPTHAYSAAFSETLLIRDLTSRKAAYRRKLTNQTQIRDRMARVAGYPRRFVENIALRESFQRTVSYSRKKIENLFIIDRLQKVVSYSRSFLENLPILDRFQRIAGYSRKQIENLSVTDSLQRVVKYSRELVEVLAIKEGFQRVTSYIRQFFEDLSLKDSFQRTVSYSRRMLENLYLQDVFTYANRYYRYLVENLSAIQDMIQRQVNYFRHMKESLLIQDVFSYIHTLITKIKHWLAYLSKKIKLRIERPSKQAEFKT